MSFRTEECLENPPTVFFLINDSFALQVEAGDVLLKVNGTDVNRFTTREGKEFVIYHAQPLIYETFLTCR